MIDPLISMDAVYEAYCEFREETGQNPQKIYLTKDEIACLKHEGKRYLIAEQEQEQGVASQDSLFGMQIVPSKYPVRRFSGNEEDDL